MNQYLEQAQQSIVGLTSDQLRDLLNDDEQLEGIVNQALVSLESEKQSILDENTRLAERNLTREPELAEQRNRLNDLSAQGKELCAQVQDLLAESKSKTNAVSQDTALALLQTAAAESEDASDAIVKQLLDKELPVEQFLEQFLVERKRMHLRKVKADKMDELAKQMRQSHALNGGGGAGGRPNSAYYNPAAAATSPGGALPYPTSPYGAGGAAGVPYPRGPVMHMPMPAQYSPYPSPRP